MISVNGWHELFSFIDAGVVLLLLLLLLLEALTQHTVCGSAPAAGNVVTHPHLVFLLLLFLLPPLLSLPCTAVVCLCTKPL
jgi:hypothetical protein